MQKIKPSKWYYSIAILIMVLGALIHITTFLSSQSKLYTRIIVPGKKDVTLSENGKYVICNEYVSNVEGRIFNTPKNISGLQCVLNSKTTGKQVDLMPIINKRENYEYRYEQEKGIAMLKFYIDQPGVYEFSCQYENRKDGQEIVLTIKQPPALLDDFNHILTNAIIASILFLLSLATGLIIFIKRRRSKKQSG